MGCCVSCRANGLFEVRQEAGASQMEAQLVAEEVASAIHPHAHSEGFRTANYLKKAQ